MVILSQLELLLHCCRKERGVAEDVEDTLEGCNLITAPDSGLQIRLEFIWFHKPSVFDSLLLLLILGNQLLDGLYAGTGGQSVLRSIHAVVYQTLYT